MKSLRLTNPSSVFRNCDRLLLTLLEGKNVSAIEMEKGLSISAKCFLQISRISSFARITKLVIKLNVYRDGLSVISALKTLSQAGKLRYLDLEELVNRGDNYNSQRVDRIPFKSILEIVTSCKDLYHLGTNVGLTNPQLITLIQLRQSQWKGLEVGNCDERMPACEKVIRNVSECSEIEKLYISVHGPTFLLPLSQLSKLTRLSLRITPLMGYVNYDDPNLAFSLPQVVLLNIEMGRDDGILASLALVCPNVRYLELTSIDDRTSAESLDIAIKRFTNREVVSVKFRGPSSSLISWIPQPVVTMPEKSSLMFVFMEGNFSAEHAYCALLVTQHISSVENLCFQSFEKREIERMFEMYLRVRKKFPYANNQHTSVLARYVNSLAVFV